MDIIRPISPPTSKGHRFILAITDYFLKWVVVIHLEEEKTAGYLKITKEKPQTWASFKCGGHTST